MTSPSPAASASSSLRRIEARAAIIVAAPDGIVEVTSKKGVVETVDDAKEIVSSIMTITGCKPRPLLVDARQLGGQEPSAQQYFRGSLNAKVVSRLAMVIDSVVGKWLANFFLALKTATPVRMFNNPEAARRWLLEEEKPKS